MTVRFIDRPCGYGKTTDMLNGLDPGELYLIVVPTLTEVERVLKARPDMNFVAPDEEGLGTKSRHLKELIYGLNNVVCTHALHHLNADFYEQGYLANYNIIIDEVLDVINVSKPPSEAELKMVYEKPGFIEIEEDGRIVVTDKWHAMPGQLSGSLSRDLYDRASSGNTYLYNKNRWLVWTLSPSLIEAGKSCTVLSFKVAGSLMELYLKHFGISYTIEKDEAEENQLRENFKDLCEIRSFKVDFRLSDGGQRKVTKKQAKSVATRLSWIKRTALRDSTGIIVTCRKKNWVDNGSFAIGSRLSSVATWIANTTRGTNDYKHCDVAIYLWDQHMNPAAKQFLGATNHHEDQYAISELLQWVYRTRLREGKPIALYLPSKRMKRLLDKWLNGDL